jgi:hypothetical protein
MHRILYLELNLGAEIRALTMDHRLTERQWADRAGSTIPFTPDSIVLCRRPKLLTVLDRSQIAKELILGSISMRKVHKGQTGDERQEINVHPVLESKALSDHRPSATTYLLYSSLLRGACEDTTG